jgi:hypothetical protein
MRAQLRAALDGLEHNGQVGRALLWDVHDLVTAAHDTMLERVRHVLLTDNEAREAEARQHDLFLCDPLEAVPYEVSELLTDTNRLVEESASDRRHGVPGAELLDGGGAPLRLILGEAGMGKTTSVLRALSGAQKRIIYARAARLNVVGSTQDILREILDVDAAFDDFDKDTQAIARRIAYVVAKSVLTDATASLGLVIDALDESAVIARRGGLQLLMNALADVRVPVALVARDEFWRMRQSDFAAAFGDRAQKKDPLRRRVKRIHLAAWTDREILALASRFRDAVVDADERARLEAFIRLVVHGGYRAIYGDIPQRPLFLAMLLEWVRHHGTGRVGRAALVAHLARAKVHRDVLSPQTSGQLGRVPITEDAVGADLTEALAWAIMCKAATLMTSIRDGSIELIDFCRSDALEADPTGIVLNTLLVPLKRSRPGEPFRVRFAHRAFQEFFLAHALLAQPELFADAAIPEQVARWRDDIVADGV